MIDRMTSISPRVWARLAGLFYLLTFGAVLGLMLRSGVIVKGDAAATAHNILAREGLYRASVVVTDIAPTAAYVCVTVLLYLVLRPVNRTVSLLAAVFSFTGCGMGAVSAALLFAPLTFLNGAPYLAAFTPAQLHALAYAFLRLYACAYSVGMVFFGVYCLLIGYLVFRSGFLPKIIGVLMGLAGLGWLIDTLSVLLSPSLAAALYPYVLLPGMIGEGALTLWLLAVGVDAQKWRAREAAAANGVASPAPI